MTRESLLEQLEAYRDAVEATALDSEAVDPLPPDLPDGHTLTAGELEAARTLLAEIEATTARLTGLQLRVNGELAGMRRPGRAVRRRAPRNVDTAI